MEGSHLLCLPIFVTVISCLLTWLNWHKYGNKTGNDYTKLPPGDGSWLSLIWDCFRWYNSISSSHPPAFVEEQVKRHGRVFRSSLFGRKAVVSADPVFNRYIMLNEGKLFQSSYPKSFRDLVGKNGVIVVHGEQQRRLHAIAMNAMRLEKLKSNTSYLRDIQFVMLQTMNCLPYNQVIVLQDVCRKVAINLMVNQLLGAREGIITKIKRTIEAWKLQSSSAGRNGVLGRLTGEEDLDDDAIADFIINLLFAGNETTAKTMLFAVYLLTLCPQALQQVLEEHENIRRSNLTGILGWEDYKSMPFTQCVIDETLRLGGIAIWLLREAKEDVKYKDEFDMDEDVLEEANECGLVGKRETGEVAHSFHRLVEELDVAQGPNLQGCRLLYFCIILFVITDGLKLQKIVCLSSLQLD
ncbi:hypothetical protein HPP92_022178 [Vanilla planifolia]|uniref:Cytochrome P450 n=1 Tax=Vanilla planifolia TaxID=51239 RepID=A0A835PRG1_VANPL|nr:hypothetical protein HPP92_022178 [Vanilla planifolia]